MRVFGSMLSVIYDGRYWRLSVDLHVSVILLLADYVINAMRAIRVYCTANGEQSSQRGRALPSSLCPGASPQRLQATGRRAGVQQLLHSLQVT